MAEGVSDIDKAIAELTADKFTAKTGIIGRFCAVRYYHESVCYYDVLIRHDQNVTTKMALGRYGVVRNNWYHLELQSVSGPEHRGFPTRLILILLILHLQVPMMMKQTHTFL